MAILFFLAWAKLGHFQIKNQALPKFSEFVQIENNEIKSASLSKQVEARANQSDCKRTHTMVDFLELAIQNNQMQVACFSFTLFLSTS